MKSKGGGLLFIACSGMELSLLFAWATFITRCAIHRPFPLPDAIGVYLLAAALLFLARGRGWRVIHVLGLQVAGFIFAAGRFVYVFNYRSEPFLSLAWIRDLLNGPAEPLEWLILVFVIFWAAVFWTRGAALAGRALSYLTVCSRFDLCIAAFLGLLLIKLILRVKLEAALPNPVSEPLMLPFFVFGLLAVGLARNRDNESKDYLSGYRAIGLILSFTSVVLLLGTGLVLIFLPYLTLTADAGYSVLKSAARPLGPVLVEILRFIFIGRRSRPDYSADSMTGNFKDLTPLTESGRQVPFWETLFVWGLMGMVGLMILILALLCAWYILRWLLSKTSTVQKQPGLWELILLFTARLQAVLLSWKERILQSVRGVDSAAQLYTRLLYWGKSSGLPCMKNETPAEYGLRLTRRFPEIEQEIGLIVDFFNQEVYGEISLNAKQMERSKFAVKKLRSPLQWPGRLRYRILQQGSGEEN